MSLAFLYRNSQPGPAGAAGVVTEGVGDDGLIGVRYSVPAGVDVDEDFGYERARWVGRTPTVGDSCLILLDSRGDPWALGSDMGEPNVDSTGGRDATAGIQESLSTVNHTVIGPGVYRVDDLLTVGAYRTLELLPGATIVRRAAHSDSTAPVVRLNGANYSRLIGLGTVQSENVSPDGIVHVGPAVQTVNTNIQRWRAQDVTIVGASAGASNIGLNLTSSEAAGPTGAGAGSNYLGTIADLDVQQVGVAVKFGEQCNAHNVSNVIAHLIGAYTYHFAGGATGVYENTVYGGFTHTKASGDITVIKMERAANNELYGVKAEPDLPGVPGSLLADLDANCADNVVFCRANMETVAQVVDLGTNNLILDKRRLQVAQLDARRGGVAIPVFGSAPTDGAFTARGITPVEGLSALDAVNQKLYVRDNVGNWLSVDVS